MKILILAALLTASLSTSANIIQKSMLVEPSVIQPNEELMKELALAIICGSTMKRNTPYFIAQYNQALAKSKLSGNDPAIVLKRVNAHLANLGNLRVVELIYACDKVVSDEN